MSHSVELRDIAMRFGQTQAVQDLSITVQPGEFFSILGPSGCGKTTILRMIAGFVAPSTGRILIGGQDMQGLGAERRPTAMIFQSLALFPLMPVWENVAFGHEARGMAKAARRARAEELLRLVALDGFADRMPSELSGGQRQRVAIARALAVEPQVLLLDEPLSALDLKLRQHMRAELRALQKRTGVTFIYITHDQSEALAMSDRVAVMDGGKLHQVATPRALYANPATPFVARFIGENNAITGRVVGLADGRAEVDTPLGRLQGRAGEGLRQGAKATLFIRPEALIPQGAQTQINRLNARVERVDFEGAYALVHGHFGDGAPMVAALPSGQSDIPTGAEIAFGFAAQDALVLADA